jgi:hypothetical protein
MHNAYFLIQIFAKISYYGDKITKT